MGSFVVHTHDEVLDVALCSSPVRLDSVVDYIGTDAAKGTQLYLRAVKTPCLTASHMTLAMPMSLSVQPLLTDCWVGFYEPNHQLWLCRDIESLPTNDNNPAGVHERQGFPPMCSWQILSNRKIEASSMSRWHDVHRQRIILGSFKPSDVPCPSKRSAKLSGNAGRLDDMRSVKGYYPGEHRASEGQGVGSESSSPRSHYHRIRQSKCGCRNVESPAKMSGEDQILIRNPSRACKAAINPQQAPTNS